MAQMVLIVLICMVGSILQTAFGFGLGPVVMAFLPMMIPYNQAIIVFLILALLSNLVLSIIYFRYINYKVLLPIMIPTVVICTITAYFAVDADADIIYLALGVFLILLSVYFFIFTDKIKIKPTVLNGTITGIICGVCGGFFALSGPAAALYFLPAIKDKNQYIGTFQFYFLIINLFNLAVRLLKGGFVITDNKVISGAVAALIAGTLIGYYVFRNFKGKWFERGVYFLIGLNGVWIVVSHFI